MSADQQILFISDLHLSSDRPQKLDLFEALLGHAARQSARLYILGDLFEDFWVGADDSFAPIPRVNRILYDFSSQSGTGLFIMRGNRDFYLDDRFAELTKCTLLDDPAIIKFGDKKVLLMHGDTLCTDDRSYQFFRRVITNKYLQFILFCLPLFIRRWLSHSVRQLVCRIPAHKPTHITDVNQQTVRGVCSEHGVDYLIHGHTHRPGIHDFKTNKAVRRFVLSDWYVKDNILIHQNGMFRLLSVQDYLTT